MELRLKPSKNNHFPTKAFVIRGSSVESWVREIQLLSFSFNDITILPIPGKIANSIWACLVIVNRQIKAVDCGRNELCQCVFPNLFIPEKSVLIPSVSLTDKERLFSSGIYIYHPEIGLTKLDETFDLISIIEMPQEKYSYVFQPEEGVFIPNSVNIFQIHALDENEAMKKMEEDYFPNKKKLPHEPLSLFEKGKLALYKRIFKNSNGGFDRGTLKKSKFLAKLAEYMNVDTSNNSQLIDQLEEDFNNLEERNKKQIDKLLDMLKKDPEEALKYAIPLDEGGVSRGTSNGLLDLSKRWGDVSIFGSTNSGGIGGGTINLGDNYRSLKNQYINTALELINKCEYEKAAFIYMKLLKNYRLAASALEQGENYQQSAIIYLKHCSDKNKAAECYEKGRMYTKAIELYEELNNYEKVGDIHLLTNNKEEAIRAYEKFIDDCIHNRKYVKASNIYSQKIGDDDKAKSILFDGWAKDIEAYRCLNYYFSSYVDEKDLKGAYEFVYEQNVTEKNEEVFLKVIEKEFEKKNIGMTKLREMAYEIIARKVKVKPRIINELLKFNLNDTEVEKDTFRYRRKK